MKHQLIQAVYCCHPPAERLRELNKAQILVSHLTPPEVGRVEGWRGGLATSVSSPRRFERGACRFPALRSPHGRYEGRFEDEKVRNRTDSGPLTTANWLLQTLPSLRQKAAFVWGSSLSMDRICSRSSGLFACPCTVIACWTAASSTSASVP